MALQKREKKREGVTFLFYGDSGSGKTPTGLSFPNQLLFDSDGGTKFYDEYNSNIITESNTLVFKELNEDLDDFEQDDDLFGSVETINVDSVTRYHENMQHAALRVVEKRARENGRLLEGEGLSPKEYGVMKLNYDRFFARMLTFAKVGKNLVFVAEQSDETENRSDGKGGTINVKVGVKPNMPKGSKFDFDVVVNTYEKDGKSYGKIQKDRTKTFVIGDVVEMPNYSHWEQAIKKAQLGIIRNKDDIKSFDDTISDEVDNLNSGGSKVANLISKIDEAIASLPKEKQGQLAAAFKENEKLGSAKFKDVKDIKKLEEYLRVAKSI